jgi:hypothetical protein
VTTNSNSNDTENLGGNKKKRNGIESDKNKLVKQNVPTGVTVLRLVLPKTEDDYYEDLDDATTEQALEAILDIMENQEEGLALVGKQEWMESWSKQDNPRIQLSDISELEQDMLTNYFQQGSEKVGGRNKEVWRFAVAGSSDTTNLLKLAKATINEANWRITINSNYFDEINFYFAGWLSGADPEVFQLTDVGNAINRSMQILNPSIIKIEEDEHGCDPTPRFGIQTIRYTATVTGRTKMSSPVYMITCVQKNLSRLRRLFPMIKGNYYFTNYNEFVSTKATQEHRWDKLGEHIAFYSAKQYFFVAGEGLSNATTTTVLSELVTHLGQTTTLRELLTSKKIFSFIQHSQAGGCKIICQHDDPTMFRSKGKPEAQQHPRQWFTIHVIGADKEPAERLDWNTKKFEPRWSFKNGTSKTTTTYNKPTSDNMGKAWTSNWRIQKDEKSAVSKLSSTGESIETIRSQLTHQQQENKKLTELTEKLKDESSKVAERYEQQTLARDQQWKIHMDSETAAFSSRMEQERTEHEATTQQTIQTYEAINERLRCENEAIKACCNSQAIQQSVMQQQLTELLT